MGQKYNLIQLTFYAFYKLIPSQRLEELFGGSNERIVKPIILGQLRNFVLNEKYKELDKDTLEKIINLSHIIANTKTLNIYSLAKVKPTVEKSKYNKYIKWFNQQVLKEFNTTISLRIFNTALLIHLNNLTDYFIQLAKFKNYVVKNQLKPNKKEEKQKVKSKVVIPNENYMINNTDHINNQSINITTNIDKLIIYENLKLINNTIELVNNILSQFLKFINDYIDIPKMNTHPDNNISEITKNIQSIDIKNIIKTKTKTQLVEDNNDNGDNGENFTDDIKKITDIGDRNDIEDIKKGGILYVIGEWINGKTIEYGSEEEIGGSLFRYFEKIKFISNRDLELTNVDLDGDRGIVKRILEYLDKSVDGLKSGWEKRTPIIVYVYSDKMENEDLVKKLKKTEEFFREVGDRIEEGIWKIKFGCGCEIIHINSREDDLKFLVFKLCKDDLKNIYLRLENISDNVIYKQLLKFIDKLLSGICYIQLTMFDKDKSKSDIGKNDNRMVIKRRIGEGSLSFILNHQSLMMLI